MGTYPLRIENWGTTFSFMLGSKGHQDPTAFKRAAGIYGEHPMAEPEHLYCVMVPKPGRTLEACTYVKVFEHTPGAFPVTVSREIRG